MKRSLLSPALLFALLLGLGGGSLEPAEASNWYIGGGFRVGGVHFSLAFDHGHRYRGPYYYRTRHHVRHPGYKCGSYCLRRSGYTFHHSGCPLVLHHFRVHGFHPARAWDYYRAPDYGRYSERGRYYGHRDYGYRGYGHRDERYRRDHRYRHRHHDRRYCPYR